MTILCILQWWIYVIDLSKPKEYTPRVNPRASGDYMMCQCRIIYGKNIPLWWVVLIMGAGGYGCVGTTGIWEISEPASQFCCKLKTALKILSHWGNWQLELLLMIWTNRCSHPTDRSKLEESLRKILQCLVKLKTLNLHLRVSIYSYLSQKGLLIGHTSQPTRHVW